MKFLKGVINYPKHHTWQKRRKKEHVKQAKKKRVHWTNHKPEVENQLLLRKVVPPNLKSRVALSSLRTLSRWRWYKQKSDKLLTSLIYGLKIIVSTLHMRKQINPKGTELKRACRTLKAKPQGSGRRGGRGVWLWVEKTADSVKE